ncbi:MAG: M48 family metallopeptidase [Candidatus Latescibacteria bacterium]|nr:M48 family metallopeptidase [Candidatus Latescibacterota bacterium]
MATNTIVFEGIGPVLFERSRRAKHINISVRPFKGVRVAVPFGVSFKMAEKIVRQKLSWTHKHLLSIKHAERIQKTENNTASINRTEAKRKLVTRLNELAEHYDFTYNRVFIRNQKTRWGSCSSKKNINLNMKLAVLPDRLIDYVILHELVHLKIPNHSKEFWTALDRLVLNSKMLKAELRKFSPGLL